MCACTSTGRVRALGLKTVSRGAAENAEKEEERIRNTKTTKTTKRKANFGAKRQPSAVRGASSAAFGP